MKWRYILLSSVFSSQIVSPAYLSVQEYLKKALLNNELLW